MTRLRRPAEGGDPEALAATGTVGGGSAGGAGAAGCPSRPGAELARGRRLRLRLAAPVFSADPEGAAATVAGALLGGGGGGGPPGEGAGGGARGLRASVGGGVPRSAARSVEGRGRTPQLAH